MKIIDHDKPKILEIDLEQELSENKISGVTITREGDVHIDFNSGKNNISVFRKIVDFIKEWKWVISPVIPVLIGAGFLDFLREILIPLLIIIPTLVISIKIAYRK